MSLRKWHGPALLKGASREGLADKGGYGAPPPSLTHGTARIWRMAGSHQRSCRGGSNSLGPRAPGDAAKEEGPGVSASPTKLNFVGLGRPSLSEPPREPLRAEQGTAESTGAHFGLT